METSINKNLLIKFKISYILLYSNNYPKEIFSHSSLNSFIKLEEIIKPNNITILNNKNIKIDINKVLQLENLLLIINKLKTIKYKSINKDFFGSIFIILECDKLDFHYNIIHLYNNIKCNLEIKKNIYIPINNKSIIQNIYKEVKMKIIKLDSMNSFHVLLPNYDYGFIINYSINNIVYMKCFRKSCNAKAYIKNNKYYLKIINETNNIEKHNHESDNKIIINNLKLIINNTKFNNRK